MIHTGILVFFFLSSKNNMPRLNMVAKELPRSFSFISLSIFVISNKCVSLSFRSTFYLVCVSLSRTFLPLAVMMLGYSDRRKNNICQKYGFNFKRVYNTVIYTEVFSFSFFWLTRVESL